MSSVPKGGNISTPLTFELMQNALVSLWLCRITFFWCGIWLISLVRVINLTITTKLL